MLSFLSGHLPSQWNALAGLFKRESWEWQQFPRSVVECRALSSSGKERYWSRSYLPSNRFAVDTNGESLLN
jgi:hypothetical protein